MKETNKTTLNKRSAMPAIADVIPCEAAEKHLEFVGDTPTAMTSSFRMKSRREKKRTGLTKNKKQRKVS
jgi:hypothetical protein